MRSRCPGDLGDRQEEERSDDCRGHSDEAHRSRVGAGAELLGSRGPQLAQLALALGQVAQHVCDVVCDRAVVAERRAGRAQEERLDHPREIEA